MARKRISKWIKKIDFWGILSDYIKGAGISIFLVLLSIFGLTKFLDQKGPPKSELVATVKCESWKAPCCIDKEVKSLDNRPFKDVAHYKYIKNVLSAKSMYTIKVSNKGDKEATNPNMTIQGNLYSEIIREIGKGDKNNPDIKFKPKEIELGPIHPERTIDVQAWISGKPGRRRARKVKITCEGRAASLCIETPVRTLIRKFDKHFLKTIIFFLIVLLLFFFFIIYQRRVIRSNKITRSK